jgi:hypothetical protein
MSEEPEEYRINRSALILGNKKVLFINTDTKNKLEQSVKENLQQIKQYYLNKGCEFIYFPEYLKRINLEDPSQREYFQYFYPFLANEVKTLYEVTEENPYSLIQDVMDTSYHNAPCLLYSYRGSSFSDKIDNLKSIFEFVDRFFGEEPSKVLFSKKKSNTIINEPNNDYNEYPPDCVDEEVIRFIESMEDYDTIKFVINLLSAKLSSRVQNFLSRIVIDKNFRIMLVDYGNIEIQLTPLQKAVYIFFLNHPEGVMFNSVYEYKEELLTIYLTISNRYDITQLRASINDLVDPLSNSLSEKCSKIRSAFLMKIDERLARQYYIDGNRGMPKKINLPRDLVTFNLRTGDNIPQKPNFVDNL